MSQMMLSLFLLLAIAVTNLIDDFFLGSIHQHLVTVRLVAVRAFPLNLKSRSVILHRFSF